MKKIPVTINFDLRYIVGYLELTGSMEKELIEVYRSDLKVELQGALKGREKLELVSVNLNLCY